MAIQALRSFIKGDRGQDLVEFTMLLAVVGLMAAAAVLGVGNTVTTVFSIMGDRYENASNGTVVAGGGGGSTGESGTGGGTGTGGDTGTGTDTGTGGNGNGNGGSGNGNGKGNK